jgi:hypothetical protein
MTTTSRRLFRSLPWLAALLLLWAAGSAFAQDVDPPGRVAHLSYRQGSVVFAPQGEEDWMDLPQNRPLTTGDRLWSDRGSRAEVQLGAATVQVDGQSHLGFGSLDDNAVQIMLQQGSVQARVRDLQDGENFEIDTPNLALRATQPGEYRVDVDTASGQTRVTVSSGMATVFGEGGQPLHLGAGQQASFAGRFLAQVQAPELRSDDFGQWAAERNRAEDQSIAARHVPRAVVGYPELDRHGTWAQDATLGAVWYPQVTVADWAPYRYGRWEWIHPWGWTWIDDAAWGFAPFHYGRWTMLANRWAWVPGRMAARPVYSPALVVFLGGGASRFNVASGPGVGWYPLAPGEAWWPTYRASPRYVGWANPFINLNAFPRHYENHVWRQRPSAITAVREDDFRRGRPVNQNWQRVQPQAIGQAQIGVVPSRPDFRRERGSADGWQRLQSTPPAALQQAVPSPRVQQVMPGTQQVVPGTQQVVPAPRAWSGQVRELPPLVREQQRAQFEQQRLQREADRSAREQVRQQEQARQQQQGRAQQQQRLLQQEQAVRQQQERGQREAWQQQRQQQQQQHQQHQQQPSPTYRVQPSPPPAAREGRSQREAEDGVNRGPRGQWNRS